MEYRQLGTDGPLISTIGFGMWAMGGADWAGSWGKQNDDESVRAIHTAIDAGITWFDTAAVYGLGHSEEVLGRALKDRREEVIVATKFSRIWDDSGKIRTHAGYDSIIRECDASLERLGTDYIDLYQQHWPDPSTPVEESMRALEDLLKAGKIRFAGVCNFDVPLLERALAVIQLTSLQPPYNLLEQEVGGEILPFCRERGLGVVVYSPLASGLLGGRYTENQTFEPGDWRSRSPEFTGEGLRRNLQIVDRLRAIAERHDKTVAQLAIAWVLANPAVTSAIIGVRKVDHVRTALPASEWHLDEATMKEIDEALKQPV